MSSIDDFVVACEVGDLAWMRRCLRSGLDPAGRDHQGFAGLHMVCKEWHCECLKYLLDHCHVEVGLTTSPGGETPLHLAVPRRATPTTEQRCVQVMRTLLDHGADPNSCCSTRGQTPLHLAARVGNIAVVKLLLQAGADIQVQGNDGLFALDMARLGGHYEVARLLQALHWAADKDHHDNRVLLQTALQEEATAIECERFARNKRYRGVRAYEAWQEQNNVSNRTHVEPGACQFRLEERARLESPGTPSTCSSCLHSSATRSEGRASRRPAMRPLNISTHQVDKNLAHVGRPGQIYPYSNYPARGDREYGRRTPSRGGSGGGGSQRKKLPLGILKSAQVRTPQSRTGEKVVSPSLSVSVVGPEPDLDHSGEEKESSVVEEKEEEEEEGLGSPGELTFHEVQQQSLSGLPDAIYLQELLGSHSPALQSPPASRDRQRRLSLSQINHRHNVYRGKMHRRLSLGAIPEGRMVREYCEEDEEDLLGSVLWNSMAWQVVLASQRQYSSAPPSPVNDAQRSILNARILGRLGTAADEERELVYSDGSSSEEDEEEEEEGRRVPRPDTPLPSLMYNSLLPSPSPPSNSSHNLSSPSSPRLTSPPNLLEDWEPPPPDQVPSSTALPDHVPSSTDEPSDQVPSSTALPDQVPSSTDEPSDQVPSSTDEPSDQVPSSTDEPSDQVPSSTDEPSDQVPSSADEPSDQVPSSTDEPTDRVPSLTGAVEQPLSPVRVVWQDRCDVPSTPRSTSLCITGGQITPSSRPVQPPTNSQTPRTPHKRESPRSRLPSRTSPLRSKSSAGIRATSSAQRLSARQTQSSCTLPLSSRSEGRVALQPTLMQFGGELVAVTAGLSLSHRM